MKDFTKFSLPMFSDYNCHLKVLLYSSICVLASENTEERKICNEGNSSGQHVQKQVLVKEKLEVILT